MTLGLPHIITADDRPASDTTATGDTAHHRHAKDTPTELTARERPFGWLARLARQASGRTQLPAAGSIGSKLDYSDSILGDKFWSRSIGASRHS